MEGLEAQLRLELQNEQGIDEFCGDGKIKFV